jgi:putative ABC transport system permease protein
MPSLHTRSFVRMIKKEWEIYTLQFFTLAVALATAIIVIAFAYQEFSRGNEFGKNVVRVLRKNETKEYEGRNRLSNRIPDEVYKHFPDATKAEDQSVYTTISGNPETVEVQLNKLFSDSSFTYRLQPARDIYFGPRVVGEDSSHGEVNCVLILLSISVLILVLATTNFINLVSLTLPDRSKEIAMRKVAGANRPGLMLLIAKETFAIVFISLLISIGILLAAPKDFTSIGILSITPISIVLLLLITVAVAPLFPAAAFIKATPGRLLGTDTITFPRMKKVITFIQLGISISLIITSLVIDRQISRSLIKEPGKNHEQIIYTKWPEGMSREFLNRLKNDWPRDNANIVDLTAISHTPDNIKSKPVDEDYYQVGVDYDFKDFLRLEMTSGRWFGPSDDDSVVVNEAGARHFPKPLGVVKDFSNDKPVHFSINQGTSNFVMIRVLEVDIRKTLNVIARSFTEISGRPTSISFLDHNYAETLAYEDRLNRFSSLLAIVSGIMACCSIYALSLSRMNDNVKQIAIRKTFGASDGQIVGRLSYQFLELMLGALFFFGPVTYLLLSEWLRNFAYSAKFSWSDPLISIGVCLVIVAITNVLMLIRINSHSLKDLLRR